MHKKIEKIILERNLPICWNMKMDELIGSKPLRFTFFPKWVLSRDMMKEFQIAAPEALASYLPNDLDFSLQVKGELIVEEGIPTVKDVSVTSAELVFTAGDTEVVRIQADNFTAGWEDFLVSELLQPSV